MNDGSVVVVTSTTTYCSSADGKPVIALIRENSKDPTLYDFHAAASHSPFSAQSQDQVNFLL